MKSAARVLDILELLFRSEEPMALKDLVSILALPKSSAHALLRTLQSRGYVERDAADRYALNESLRQSSGWIGGPEAHLAAVARPVMDQLRDDLDETVFLGVRAARGDVKVIAKSVSRAQIRYDFDDPGLRPAYCTGMGRILLAFWDKKSTDAYLMRTRLARPHAENRDRRGQAAGDPRQGGGRRLCRSRGGIRARRIGDGGTGVRRRWYGRCCAECGNGVSAVCRRPSRASSPASSARRPPSASVSATGARHRSYNGGIQR